MVPLSMKPLWAKKLLEPCGGFHQGFGRLLVNPRAALQGAASGGLEQLLQAIPSGELQQLVAPSSGFSGSLGDSPFQPGAYGARTASLGMGKLESLELPDAAAAVAMLHDMPTEVHLLTTFPLLNLPLKADSPSLDS